MKETYAYVVTADRCDTGETEVLWTFMTKDGAVKAASLLASGSEGVFGNFQVMESPLVLLGSDRLDIVETDGDADDEDDFAELRGHMHAELASALARMNYAAMASAGGDARPSDN